MSALLYESLALLEGLPMVEDLRSWVMFDWREFDETMEGMVDSDLVVDSIGPPTRNFPLLRLPPWMHFTILIGPGSDWFTKGAIDRWLDEGCSNEQMRSRIRVKFAEMEL